MTKRILPTPGELRQLLRYEPETGKLFWKPRPLDMFLSERAGKSWNTKWSGKEALTSIDNHGYRKGDVFGRTYKAHRVIWAIHYGEWPEDKIDHRDNDKLNNRIVNLREATNSENAYNRGAWKSNATGFKGVSWVSGAKPFRAQIGFGGKLIHLGCHATAESAHAAYCEAAEKYHGEFARTE